MSRPQIEVFPDVDTLARAAAERFARTAEEAIARQGRFAVALSGGSTPRPLYALLATPAWHRRIPWNRTGIFWGDERAVPPSDPASNFGAARTTLLDHVPILKDQVFRVKGELPAEVAAEEYSQVLAKAFTLGPGERPRFDLILLGLGLDGHTASLFPASRALADSRLVAASEAPTSTPARVTLTAPTINHAAHVMFIVTGSDKAETVAAVIEGPHRPTHLPAQLVAPTNGTLTWLLDEPAASLLTSR